MDEPKPMRELTRIRQERNLSQQRLADASGVNKATINQIERGRRSPNVETLEKLATALGVEMGDLFPKGQASLLDFAGERREADTAERLIRFGERMVARFDSELEGRVEAEDLDWFEHARVMYGEYVAILNMVNGRGVSDPQGVFGSLMDMNASMQTLMRKYEEVALRIHSRSEEARGVTTAEARERASR
jgi:transcriptional regulator with XRE-family HTH domain